MVLSYNVMATDEETLLTGIILPAVVKLGDSNQKYNYTGLLVTCISLYMLSSSICLHVTAVERCQPEECPVYYKQ